MPAAIPLVLMAGGAVMQGVAARQAGKSAEALGKYKATLARGEAKTTRLTTAETQRLKRAEMRRTLASNREITATSGMMMTGSPAEQQLQVINDYAYDIARTGHEGEAIARRSESMAELYDMEAKSAARAGKMGMWTALFGGAANIGSASLSNYTGNTGGSSKAITTIRFISYLNPFFSSSCKDIP